MCPRPKAVLHELLSTRLLLGNPWQTPGCSVQVARIGPVQNGKLFTDSGDRHLASRGGRQSKDVETPRGGGSDPPSKKFTPLGGGV